MESEIRVQLWLRALASAAGWKRAGRFSLESAIIVLARRQNALSAPPGLGRIDRMVRDGAIFVAGVVIAAIISAIAWGHALRAESREHEKTAGELLSCRDRSAAQTHRAEAAIAELSADAQLADNFERPNTEAGGALLLSCLRSRSEAAKVLVGPRNARELAAEEMKREGLR